MAESITLDELRRLAKRADLELSDEELQRMLPALTRSRMQAAQLRDLISDSVEPAGTFAAVRGR